jgi:hypothetical protein
MKQRQRRAISATGFGALATALAGAPLPARADGSANHPAPNWGFTTSSANDVGCIKTTVEDPQNKAMHGFLFSRPQGIDIESLSDEELRSCGLQDRRRIRNLSKESPKYQAWLAEAHARLTATQILPWGKAPLRKGYVPPPPPILAPGQPGMLPLGPPPPMVIGPRSIHDNVDHSDLARGSVLPGINVSPDGYTPFLQPTFS